MMEVMEWLLSAGVDASVNWSCSDGRTARILAQTCHHCLDARLRVQRVMERLIYAGADTTAPSQTMSYQRFLRPSVGARVAQLYV